LLQSLLAAVVSLPVLVVNATQPTPLTVLSFVGLIIWAVGFYFEAVGDYQLKQFISHPSNKGKLMTKGVWNYTRHPNYFGEIAQWWGIFVISLAVSGYWWLAIIGPLVITGLLVFVSGVPLTEKHFASKPGWEEYKRRTSKLLPLPPKQQ
jgi:steroid 5-alpha reductase family enzyme